MTEKLYKKDKKLLKRIIKNKGVSVKSLNQDEQLSIERLLDYSLIKKSNFDINGDPYNDDSLSVEATEYSATNQGRRYFKELREDNWREIRIHILYPTVVNLIWGIGGFFIGWFFKILISLIKTISRYS